MMSLRDVTAIPAEWSPSSIEIEMKRKAGCKGLGSAVQDTHGAGYSRCRKGPGYPSGKIQTCIPVLPDMHVQVLRPNVLQFTTRPDNEVA